MAYIIPHDYLVNIQDANIQQIISNDESIRTRAQLAGEAEAKSYLVQKYDTTREFQDINAFSYSVVYSAFNRFYLDASAYNVASTYNIKALTLYNGDVYSCNTNATTGAFNPAKWDKLGAQYKIFTVKAPNPEFDYSALYKIGDNVIWKNKVYECKVPTVSFRP